MTENLKIAIVLVVLLCTLALLLIPRRQARLTVTLGDGKTLVFRAWGDGRHDDTQNIQQAISAAASGGTVSIPEGRFLLTSQIRINENTPENAVRPPSGKP